MMNFYQNTETKEIISFGVLTTMDNWREKIGDGLYVAHSKYHPILDGLETVEVEIEYGTPTNETDFMLVPLEMLLDNINDRSIWEGCPRLINLEVLGCLEAIIERGDYPYNSTIVDEFNEKFDCEGSEHGLLSAIVFNTQTYNRLLKSEISSKELDEQMKLDGFQKLTKELIEDAVGSKRRFVVYLDSTNMLGGTTTTKSDNYLYIRSKGEGTYLWMKPRATRNGFTLNTRQYVKEVFKK